jgi:flagellin-specific chaperone FliS
MAAAFQIRTATQHVRGPKAWDAGPLSMMHFESALRSLTLASETPVAGSARNSQIRSAMIQIRKLCATLALQADRPMAANLGDLGEYMCRELKRVVSGVAGPAKLEDICELLREIRCAWMTAPGITPTMLAGAARAVYVM